LVALGATQDAVCSAVVSRADVLLCRYVAVLMCCCTTAVFLLCCFVLVVAAEWLLWLCRFVWLTNSNSSATSDAVNRHCD
jgi:hypothetical protein